LRVREVGVNVVICTCTFLIATFWVVGCATPAPPPASVAASEPVKVTAALADAAGCNLLGKVVVSDSVPDPAKAARDETAGLGGNLLVRKNEQVWNGNAYHCPAGH
jgi:hypothetical protein